MTDTFTPCADCAPKLQRAALVGFAAGAIIAAGAVLLYLNRAT